MDDHGGWDPREAQSKFEYRDSEGLGIEFSQLLALEFGENLFPSCLCPGVVVKDQACTHGVQVGVRGWWQEGATDDLLRGDANLAPLCFSHLSPVYRSTFPPL